MKLTNTAVRRGVTFTMIYLIAVGFGFFGLSQLKVDLYPELEFPMLAIITQYQGVGPEDIETVVTRTLEEAVATTENIKTVSSESSQGLSLIMLEFSWGTDMDQAEIDVRNNLEFVRDFLPDDVTDPLLFKFDISQSPIMYFTVNSDQVGLAELRYIAEHDVEPRMERISGVAAANTSGGLTRQIRVMVDPIRLRAHNLSIQQVTQALQMNNLQIPSGFVENDRLEFTVQTQGEYQSVDQIAETAVMSMNGSVIRVKDVADVVDGFKEIRNEVWADGQPAVMIWVQKQSDANTVEVSRNVFNQLDGIQDELPGGVSLNLFWAQSEFIEMSMNNLGSTALQAILLAFMVLLFFLRNFRSSLIVAVSIPISMLLTFAVMMQVDLTLNVISMAGLALAVGLLVDNAIVVLESIYRKREEGESRVDSANNGTSEVGMAITASTLTTISVFVPILFVPGLSGELFRDMGLTITLSLAVSLIVALTLVPLLSSRFLKIRNLTASKRFFHRLGAGIEKRMNKLYDQYSKNLNWALHHRKLVLIGAFAAFIISMAFLGTVGAEFLPQNDQGFIEMTVERSPGVSLEQMAGTMSELNEIVKDNVPERELVYTDFGQGEGIMALFGSNSSAEGSIQIRLPSVSKRDRDQFEIQDSLRHHFERIPDTDVKFSDGGFGAMFGAGDIVVQIYGYDLQVADALANELKAKIDKIEGVVFTETTLEEAAPELTIKLNRDRIADLGLNTSMVGTAVSQSILGATATRFRDGGDEHDVYVQLDKEFRTSKEDLENLLIATPVGRQVPMRVIADIEYSKAPQTISREDQERHVDINIDVSGRELSKVTQDVKRVLNDTPLPRDFRSAISGQAEEQAESFMYLGIALLVALFLTYMVMASQFESFVDPFIILFTVPLSTIGVALALVITNTPFSAMVFIGIIMLIGIVVNNGIVLVDYINQLRGRGLELLDAVQQGGRIRIRPVLMTAMTTILAMFPLSLGIGESGEAWAPMARAVMGGLLVSTILTLVVVPTFYTSLEMMNKKRKDKKAAKKAAKEGRLANL